MNNWLREAVGLHRVIGLPAAEPWHNGITETLETVFELATETSHC